MRTVRDRRCFPGWILVVLAPLATSLVARGLVAEDGTCPPGGTQLTWDNFALPFFLENCYACHDWTNYTTVYQSHGIILDLVSGGLMPAGGSVSDEDKARLAEWMACDLPVDIPPCPPGGVAVGYDFAADFFAEKCSSCHSSALVGAARNGAPDGTDFDVYDNIVKFAPSIVEQVLKGKMPPNLWVSPGDIDAIVAWGSCGAPVEAAGSRFRRGDANADGIVDLSDAVAILAHLFEGGELLECADAADTDGTGLLNITDAVYILRYLFLGGTPPPPPFLECGVRLSLGCDAYNECF